MRYFLAFGILLCSIPLALRPVSAAARLRKQVTPTAQNDGNHRVGIAKTCTSSAWTLVAAANADRRNIKLKAADSNTGTICLGTDDSGGTCSASAQLGYELGTGDGYEDAAEGALYCRSDAGSQVVKGFDLDDSSD